MCTKNIVHYTMCTKKTLCILLCAPKTLCTLLCAVHQKHCVFYYLHQAIICALYYVHQKHCAFYYVHQAIMCALYYLHQTKLYIAHNTGFTHILHNASVHCALQCGPSTCALGTKYTLMTLVWHKFKAVTDEHHSFCRAASYLLCCREASCIYFGQASYHSSSRAAAAQ